MSRSLWYFDHDGKAGGPVSVSQLRQMAASGLLLPTDRIRKEDMDRWVKARAVKGLFAPDDLPSAADDSPAVGSMFDFFGANLPTAPLEPANEFIPAFDFFSGSAAPAEAKIEPLPPIAPLDKKTKLFRKPKPDSLPLEEIPIAAPAPQPTVEDSGSFQLIVPMAVPVEPQEEGAAFADFQADVPMAMPASDIDEPAPPVSAELAGPEVIVLADGTAQLTGSAVELSVTGSWLAARSAAPDGKVAEAYLRLRLLMGATLRDRPGIGMVLSFRAGAEIIAVQCDGDGEAARAFVRRVLEAAEEK